VNRPKELLPVRTAGSGLTHAQWAYFLDRPVSDAELERLGESHWTNYRLNTNSSTFGSRHDGGYGFTERLWGEYEADVLDAWVQDYPGTRPSQWWRWQPEKAREGEATWELLDRLDLWLEGERERAEALVGRLKRGQEVMATPMHSDWTPRGRYRPQRD
jgi:hypothetical protein